MSLWTRIVGVFYAEDEAINAAAGGKPTETISGTIGRAAAKGAWWAKWFAQPLVNLIMRNPQHCQQAAAAEAARAAANRAA